MYYINYFISHSWNYSGHYDTLVEWINSGWSYQKVKLNFLDFSIPKDDPSHNAHNEKELFSRISDQIQQAHVVIIPTGMYSARSKWIQNEIDASKHLGKPILGVDPWGQERASSVVIANATEVVGWNSKSVVSGIVNLAINND
jgi:hypothetical protein